MALRQIELIRSFDETLQWFERELQWGVPVADLDHLVARICKLFFAINCNGQLTQTKSQSEYDVVSHQGDRYSINFIAGETIEGEINFSRAKLEAIDSVAVVFFNTSELEVEILLDSHVEDLGEYVTVQGNKIILPLELLRPKNKRRAEMVMLRDIKYKDYMIYELENGKIDIELYGDPVPNRKSVLLKLARELNIPIQSGMGRVNNARQLGTQILDTLEATGK